MLLCVVTKCICIQKYEICGAAQRGCAVKHLWSFYFKIESLKLPHTAKGLIVKGPIKQVLSHCNWKCSNGYTPNRRGQGPWEKMVVVVHR